MDSAPLGKGVQDRNAVVAYGRYTQAEFVELGLVPFQLHELGFAEGSPIRRAVKQNHRTLRTQQAFQTLQLAFLIG